MAGAGFRALLVLAAATGPCLALHSSTWGRKILAGGKPISLKGVNWNPVAAGKTQSHGGVDFRGFVEADSMLMKAAGINAVRTYLPILDREVLDILWHRGIHVLNTVYLAADASVQGVVKPVAKLKDHPAILMWCVGNEWNYNHLYNSSLLLDDALSRVAEATRLIKKLDTTHLVATVYGMMPPPEHLAALKHVDVWGLTAYTGISFGTLFNIWEQRSGKPMFLAEFGADAYNAKAKVEDEASQAKATTHLAREILAHSVLRGGVCSGGLLFELADEWWKDSEGSPNRQDVGGVAPGGGPFPDRVFNEEYWGIIRIDGSPRQAFAAYAALPPVGHGLGGSNVSYRLRACGASSACAGMLGNCCPTREGAIRGCCSAEARLAAERRRKGEQSPGEVTRAPATSGVPATTAAPPTTAPRPTHPGRLPPQRVTARPPVPTPSRTAAPTPVAAKSTVAPQPTTAAAAVRTGAPRSTSPAPPAAAVNLSNPVASTSEACRIERNIDYSGGDLADVGYVESAQTCATICAAHPSCKSFTYLKTNKGCYLKRSVRPGRRASTCCDSGLPCSQVCLLEHNYDYSGDDLASIGNIPSATACAALCARNTFCKSFTYKKATRLCFLKKSTMPGRTASRCCDSGLPCSTVASSGTTKTPHFLPPATSTPSPQGFHMDIQVTPRHEMVASIAIGTPPQAMRCLVDSSSADLWIPSWRCRRCGDLHPFKAAASSTFIVPEVQWRSSIGPKMVNVSYGDGVILGYPVMDTLQLGASLQVPNQSFIIVEDSTMPPQRSWDGICGLGWLHMGKVHNPFYTRMRELGHRAVFSILPTGRGRSTMVIGAVPSKGIQEGSLVWVTAESFQPGTMSQWVQRSFWVTTGGLQIHMPTPVSVRFLVDTGVREALLAPPKHFIKFLHAFLPPGALDTRCTIDQWRGHQVTCDCSVLEDDLLPLQIHLGGQPFSLPAAELFNRVQISGQEWCQLEVLPNPKASSQQSKMLDGIGGFLGGLMTNILVQDWVSSRGSETFGQQVPHSPPRLSLKHQQLKESPWPDEQDAMDTVWVLGGIFLSRFVVIFDFDKALLGFGRPTVEIRDPASADARTPPEELAAEVLKRDEAGTVVAGRHLRRPSAVLTVTQVLAASGSLVLVGLLCSWVRGRCRPGRSGRAYDSLSPARRPLQRERCIE